MDRDKAALGIEPARHWIDGEWVRSATLARSVNPSTGEVLGQYSAGGRIEAAAAIAAARRSFDLSAWSHDPQLRSRALRELADRLGERAEAIALMLSREMGKTLRDATFEATLSPSTLRYNAGTALSSSPKMSIVHKESPAPSRLARCGPTPGESSATLSKRAASSTVASDARVVFAPWRNFRRRKRKFML